jgi:3-hydroxyacyl-CoA dehydrogenase/enoyl-CoA hydratase/3-hydroxybutyryl-CoA epimerase
MTEFGWPVGPFTLMDEVGLAVAHHAGETVAAALGTDADTRNAVAVLNGAGLLGKRGGEGFYRYEGKKKTPNVRVYQLLEVSARPALAGAETAERLTALFVNAAAQCLDEGVLRSAAEGDLGAVLGLGFPPFLGGPFRYADSRGAALRDLLRALADHHGPRYGPAESLANGRRYFP